MILPKDPTAAYKQAVQNVLSVRKLSNYIAYGAQAVAATTTAYALVRHKPIHHLTATAIASAGVGVSLAAYAYTEQYLLDASSQIFKEMGPYTSQAVFHKRKAALEAYSKPNNRDFIDSLFDIIEKKW